MFQRKLKSKAIVIIGLFRAFAVEGFTATPTQQYTATVCYGTAAPHESSKPVVDVTTTGSSRIEFVDFWGTKWSEGVEDQFCIAFPTDPYLDRHDGPLPHGAYQVHGNTEFDPKPNCRIALSLDWWDQTHSRFQLAPLDADQVVRQIQGCLDAGFQSFQLSPGSKTSQNGLEMIGRVVRETPKCLDMHWTARLELPKLISPTSVREVVIELLSTTRMDSLDTILVPYDSEILPQYYFEVMDALHDMQRDGYLRSIGVENWPAALVKQAQEYGFNIHVHQQRGNLLLPPPPLSMKGGGEASPVAQWWTNPLADNFLTDNVSFIRNPPVHANGWKDVRTWHNRKHHNKRDRRNERGRSASVSDFDVWKVFKKDVYENLRLLSCKYEVSIESIALRWCLQQKATRDRNLSASSIIHRLSLVEETEGQLTRQLGNLRDVFRFGLDGEDMEILDSLVARSKPKATTIRIDDIDVPIGEIPVNYLKEFEALSAAQNDDEFMEYDGDDAGEDYPEIDFNNPTLWL